MITHKKSQAWGMDISIAMIIFSIGFIVLMIYSTNNSDDAKEKLENLQFDGEFLMNNLFSSGYPIDWNSSNLITIGIMDNGKINETKLKIFYELANNDYNRTKTLFNTRYDYYFFFSENITINLVNIKGIGKPGFDKNDIHADNLIKITRFTIYQEKPINAYLYIMG